MTTEYYNTDEEESSFDFSQIISIAKRRFFFFLIPAVIGAILAVVVVYLIPQRYESLGTVLVESQQIPVELVQSTVTSDPNQRITTIRQRVMTRSNLIKIIDKYDVFAEDRKRMSVTNLIGQMQERILLEVIRAEGTRRGGATTIAFKVGFRHENPKIASSVANEFVTLFLSENVKTRTERASETTQFLEQEADKLKQQLNAAEEAISEYKRQHGDSLPEYLGIRMGTLERTEAEIKAIRNQIENLREERKYLELELSSARTGTLSQSGTLETPDNTTNLELEKTKDQLTQALSQLTEKHPTVKGLKRRVKALEDQLAEELSSTAEETSDTATKSVSPAKQRLLSRIQIRLESNTQAISAARANLEKLQAKAEETEQFILKTPDIERQLVVLNRTYNEIFAKYSELEAKQGKARLAQNLEEEKKAERFLLLEPPIVPTEPVWPNRPQFIGMGFALAIAAGLGTAILMELVDRRVRTANELEKLLKSPPLVSIPYIRTQRDIQKKRYKLGAILLAPTVVIAAGAVMVHLFYKPLDLLFYRIWVMVERLNILPF